jgi:HTH-type transcriptional repressor of NAD biosynthesis genes
VIGKFYPPHAGHHHLVESAAARCERLSVLVMAAPQESIPLAERVAWRRAAHADEPGVRIVGVTNDVRVDYDDPHIWAAHVALMEAAIAADTVLAGAPPEAATVDAVFSSEPYGEELARRMGARHVPVDPARAAFPVSGTAVRADVPGLWERLRPATRAGLALRVVVLGAESTGTTTLARELAERLRERGGVWAGTAWVPGYGREYTAGRLAAARAQAARAGRPAPGTADLVWTPEDFDAIARRQIELEDAAAAAGGPLLVCDTDALATAVRFTRYLGGPARERRHPVVEALAGARRHPLYLLTDPDGVEFEQDGPGDGESVRAWMTAEFAARLDERGATWLRLTGGPQQRLAAALAACDDLIAAGWRLADPKLPGDGR